MGYAKSTYPTDTVVNGCNMAMYWTLWLLCGIVLAGKDQFYKIPKTSKYTVVVPKAEVWCFYQPINPAVKQVTLQYEVTKADFDLDIDCIVKDVAGRQLTAVRRRKGRKVDIPTAGMSAGDLEVCFSNHYSRLSEKHVYIHLSLDTNSGFASTPEEELKRQEETESEEDKRVIMKELSEITTGFKDSSGNMAESLQRGQGLLGYLMAALKQDEQVLIACMRRMDFWMKLNLFISLVCVFRQVNLIKSVFGERIKLDSRRQSRA